MQDKPRYIILNIDLHESILRKKIALLNFKEGGKDLSFKSVESLGNDLIEIENGVWVRVLDVVNEDHFILFCKMTDKSELALHRHSDYSERFLIKKGALFDKYSHRFIDKETTYHPNEWHNLVSVGECEMIIHCIR